MLIQVISGGQTGADMGGLIAAHTCCLRTGGWMPKGFLTLEGPRPDLAVKFGMQEHASVSYPPRTRRNVQLSDATIRFARHWNTNGERATLRFLQQYRRPYLDIRIDSPPAVQEVADWLLEHRVRISNIAGNTERNAPGIEEFVIGYLTDTFRRLKRFPAPSLRNGMGENGN